MGESQSSSVRKRAEKFLDSDGQANMNVQYAK